MFRVYIFPEAEVCVRPELQDLTDHSAHAQNTQTLFPHGAEGSYVTPARFIMTPSLSFQLGLMYGKNTDQDLEVILINTQKQTNGVECGLFCNSASDRVLHKRCFEP